MCAADKIIVFQVKRLFLNINAEWSFYNYKFDCHTSDVVLLSSECSSCPTWMTSPFLSCQVTWATVTTSLSVIKPKQLGDDTAASTHRDITAVNDSACHCQPLCQCQPLGVACAWWRLCCHRWPRHLSVVPLSMTSIPSVCQRVLKTLIAFNSRSLRCGDYWQRILWFMLMWSNTG